MNAIELIKSRYGKINFDTINLTIEYLEQCQDYSELPLDSSAALYSFVVQLHFLLDASKFCQLELTSNNNVYMMCLN